ncbi:MAG: bifunctional tetrahydrofolate synthase/dihydrofolate synthase [Gammaproteobacteria bacterium]
MKRFDSLQEWLAWQESLHPRMIDLGLDRVDGVFRALHPHYKKPPTITVAGTNGKGSCVAILESIYRAQGYRVGTYTSPHIVKYNERIKIDGTPVTDEMICSAFERIESVRDNISLSYFEFGTLAALDIFSHNDIEVQLLEVGLGGRLDAVNIIDPDAAVVTGICIDHVDWLGDTRENIGREKAGVFRRNVVAIIGDIDPPASLAECAEKIGAPILFVGKDFGYRKNPNSWDWFCGEHRITNLPPPNLKGEHQYRNASSALVAVMKLQHHLPVSDTAIKAGIENVQLAGRFQFIDEKIPVLLDVGHNPQAARTLAEHLHEQYAGRKVHAVFSMMKDKDIQGVLKVMKPFVSEWYFAPLPGNPRSAPEALMREAFALNSMNNVRFGLTNFQDAFEHARANADQGDLLLVFGSFFLVSEYMAGKQ